MTSTLADRLPPDRFEEVARMVLETPTYEYIRGGAGEEITLAENLAALRRWRLVPRVLAGDVTEVELSTTAAGTDLDFPVLVAPMAVHRIADADGEVSTAKAAAEVGSALVVAANASVAVEEVARANPGARLWLQLYNWADREALAALIARGEAAGVRAIVATVNTPIAVSHGRPTTGFRTPPGVTYAHFDAFRPLDGGLDWSYVEWLKSRTALPVIVKGVLSPADGVRAAESGAAGIIVSNHGGRQLDRSIATIDALPAVVDAAGGKAEIYVDGGIRHGTDVLIALALGARAVFIGRPVMWGLAVGGASGVAAVLRHIREELREDMALSGVRSVAELGRAAVARVAR
jgi:isopentenyl diphosphate isomerase/L-lactate dehydrogenase-like FMN-dependent dehydrogenase